MKKLFLGIVILILVSVVYADKSVNLLDKSGKVVNPGDLTTVINKWVVLNTAKSDGNEPNDLTVSQRTYTAVAALLADDGNAVGRGYKKISVFSVPSSWNGARFRCRGISEDNSVVHQIYLGDLGLGGTNCILSKAGTLTWSIGAQTAVDPNYKMADTLTVASTKWTAPDSNNVLTYLGWNIQSPDSNNVAEAQIDLRGSDVIVVVATTTDCNSQLIGKGY